MPADGDYEVSVSQNFRYCCDVYKLMAEEAKDLNAEQTGTVAMVVWEGFFTKLIVDRMGLSVPYYSTVRRELMRMGCIRQLRRGGGSSPSQWELLREPTEELWHNAPAKRSLANTKQDATASQVQDLARRLTRMEENFDVLMEALTEGSIKVAFDEPKREGAGPKQYETIEE